MKRTKRILLSAGCIMLVLISWIVAITAKTDAQKQRELLDQAAVYLEDEVYILSVPLLEEAAGYEDSYTGEAEQVLKEVYLHLIEQRGYSKKYRALLDKQMARQDAAPEIFEEAARYYLSISKSTEAYEVLRSGIERTGSQELIRLYEENRYQYRTGRTTYQDVTATCNGSIQVMQDGLWGLAAADGSLTIPCEYDAISTYGNGRAIVRRGTEISAVNSDNNRLALFHGEALEIGNYANDRMGLQTREGWILANGSFTTGSIVFEELGMFSDGYAPAKVNGRWGVVDTSGSKWLIPAEYDGIIQDELGRCMAQNAVFVVKNDQVLLLVDGEQVGGPYEDARPFADGWAAVKLGGRWGFIDTTGTVQIQPQFEDALSFGQHVAAVQIDGLWGYISLYGEVAIEPVYLGAKSFYDGSAPVCTDAGWRFITLVEYEEGASL